MFTRNMSRRTFVGGASATAAVMAASRPGFAQDSSAPTVVATFSILADWTQRVAGDVFTVVNLVPAGGDAHTFDPSPEQVASIADADVIFQIGLEFETWLDRMIESSGTKAERITVSDGVEVLMFEEGEGDEHDHEEEGHDHEATPEAGHDDHDHGSQDPHIWGDVQNAIIAVTNIISALSTIDPANAAAYGTNGANYLAELQQLDASIRTDTSTIPAERRKLVTTHDTFGYYAHAYDFEIVGTALGSISTEGGDPSAQEIADLVNEIKSEGVPVIFAENVTNPDLMQSIADEAGVELGPTLFTDALGDADSKGSTYIDMMTYNTSVFVTALA